MTDKKISELTSITGADVSDANDVLPIVDTSVATTKKITRAELFKNVSSVDINDKITHTGDTNTAIRFPAADTVTVETAGSEKMRINSSGRVGIGTTSPSALLDVQSAETFVSEFTSTNASNTAEVRVKSSGGVGGNTRGRIIGGYDAGGSEYGGYLAFNTTTTSNGNAERMRINSSGRVGIGTTSPSALLDVQSAETFVSEFTSTNASNTAEIRVRSTGGSGSNTRGRIIGGYDAGGSSYGGYLAFNTTSTSNVNTERMRIDSSGRVGIGTTSPSEKLSVTGNVTISGSLSKGSGSFKIDHPLKPDTHYLVHSFIEGPQADNIYRGKVTLADGKATVNLDEAGRMTEGTFVALNGNVQCFTTNEDGWTAVRGKVEGNILTIEAQDAACADTVSWLVIGERHDQHMIEANWTDDQGRIITEPEKGIA